ncbi:MAG: hypothetical protein ACU837_01615 [Gammaproteobacteria bacterium]
MKLIKLQPIAGFLLLAWTGLGMAQNAETNLAAELSQRYEALQETAPPMTEEQQQLFEHEIKTLEFKQAWERHYTNAAGAENAQQDDSKAESEFEEDEDVNEQ